MINVGTIKRHLDQKIELLGLVKADKDKQDLRLLILHLCLFIEMYRMLRRTMAYDIAAWMNKICDDYGLKMDVKEGKKKKRKEKTSPTPLSIKEKIKEKEVQKNKKKESACEVDFEEIQKAWFEQLKPFCKANGGKYENSTIERFFSHWSERVGGSDMMLWQKEQERKSWSLKNRIKSWAKSRCELEAQAAEIRLEQVKKGKSATAPLNTQNSEEQKRAAAEREEANAKREAEIEKSKADAVSAEEYMSENPNGGLAKLFGIQKKP